MSGSIQNFLNRGTGEKKKGGKDVNRRSLWTMRSVCIKALNQFFFIISLGRGFCTPRPSGVYFPIHPSSRQCTDTITACANLSLIYFTCEWKIFRFLNLWVEKIIRFGSSNELHWAVEKNESCDLDSTDCVAHLLFRLASR